MKLSILVEEVIIIALEMAKERKSEYVTPEHVLLAMSYIEEFENAFKAAGGDISKLRDNLEGYLKDNILEIEGEEPEVTKGFNDLLLHGTIRAEASGKEEVELTHILDGIVSMEESFGAYYILTQVEWSPFLYELCEEFSIEKEGIEAVETEEKKEPWKSFVSLINDEIESRPPLIGREKELERTMQILCRKFKNNIIHIGEAGVGKTSIIYGLAKLINEGKVPEKLNNSQVFSMDLGDLLAGTQYRGDFEKRFKMVMEGIKTYENPILYIDEIHNIVGAGAINGGGFDVSNMLKPYLSDGEIRIIGATTYDEFNKHLSKSKSLLRRFQNIDIKEPNCEECLEILKGLKGYYEDFHKVKYTKGTLEYAISLSHKYMKERYLPDKAIDLIDEAGAFRVMHPLNKKEQSVDKKLIDEVLSKSLNIPMQIIEVDEIAKLKGMEEHLCNTVFGQEEGIGEIVKAIKMSRAGLNEEDKPVANLLFVGPTGVGKTEISKALSKELDLELVRFDMSEYAEKHTVAKLIGAPAGYVGYEEGGLLTDEVRKNPHCILLLDEIEKAHSDIFNILLQVMDYATLTDNQGRKTDFRNVILIMTSNSGASKVGKSLIGFGERSVTRDGILEAVKKTFNPEFRNRLTKIVVFNPLNSTMSRNIVIKKLEELKGKLQLKKVGLSYENNVVEYLVAKGISEEYGAREILRVIDKEIKTLLVDEILFGKLRNGGEVKISIEDNKVVIAKEESMI